MPKFKKTTAELETELYEQIEALRASLASYDLGNSWEAKRIATALYTLCFDGSSRTKSLLGMLNLKNGMKFISSSSFPKYNGKVTSASASAMVLLEINSDRASYLPKLSIGQDISPLRQLSFFTWWSESILHPASSLELNRRKFVCIMRSQDGGAHVDDHLQNLEYTILKSTGDPFAKWHEGSVVFGGNEGEPIKGIVPAIMRQIGWEFDQTLQLHGL